MSNSTILGELRWGQGTEIFKKIAEAVGDIGGSTAAILRLLRPEAAERLKTVAKAIVGEGEWKILTYQMSDGSEYALINRGDSVFSEEALEKLHSLGYTMGGWELCKWMEAEYPQTKQLAVVMLAAGEKGGFAPFIRGTGVDRSGHLSSWDSLWPSYSWFLGIKL